MSWPTRTTPRNGDSRPLAGDSPMGSSPFLEAEKWDSPIFRRLDRRCIRFSFHFGWCYKFDRMYCCATDRGRVCQWPFVRYSFEFWASVKGIWYSSSRFVEWKGREEFCKLWATGWIPIYLIKLTYIPFSFLEAFL
jgi:hypothetical protein